MVSGHWPLENEEAKFALICILYLGAPTRCLLTPAREENVVTSWRGREEGGTRCSWEGVVGKVAEG